MKRTWLVSVLALLAASLLPVGSAGAATVGSARPDPAFGSGGLVDLSSLIPAPAPNSYGAVSALTPGRDGSSYGLVVAHTDCGPSGCLEEDTLLHYEKDGSPDTSFGADGVVKVGLPGESVASGSLLVDGRGRAIVASETQEGEFVLRRFEPDGRLDGGWGDGGVVRVGCRCRGNSIQLSFAGQGRLAISVASPAPDPNYGTSGISIALLRLLPNGARDRGFAGSGETRLELPPGEGLQVMRANAKGMAYLAGSRECCHPGASFLDRFSSKGRLDTRFDERTKQTLTRGGIALSFHEAPTQMLLRPQGRIDLFGTNFQEAEPYVVRLRPNGSAQPGFGRSGTRSLPFLVNEATLDGSGGTLITTTRSRPALMRLLPSDRLDRAFGRDGAVPLKSYSESEKIPTLISGRRLMVTDLGYSFCRGPCQTTPSISRYLLLPRPGKR